MSLISKASAACPACSTLRSFDRVVSVNADRRPDLRAAIVDGSFQREQCGQCSHPFKPPPLLTYLDIARRNWILVQAFEEQENWERFGEIAAGSFAMAYGDRAPPDAQASGRDLRVRLVFGWSALREKLRCDDLRLNDIDLELLKLSVLRESPDSPLSDETELRLLGVKGPELLMGWVRGRDERMVATLRVPRSTYDELVFNRSEWQTLREEMAAHSFVDMNRLMLGPQRA